MSFWKKTRKPDGTDDAIRRLFEAASTKPSEIAGPPQFFMTRLKGAVAEAQRARRSVTDHPIGAAAWQMLPAMAIMLVALTAWTGYESAQVARAQEEAIARMMVEPAGGGADLLLVAMITGGGAK